jgi:hypothetical protein
MDCTVANNKERRIKSFSLCVQGILALALNLFKLYHHRLWDGSLNYSIHKPPAMRVRI